MTRNEAIIYLMRAISDAIDARIAIGSEDWYRRQSMATDQGKRALMALGVTEEETMALIDEAFPVAKEDRSAAMARMLDIGVPAEHVFRLLDDDDDK